MKNLLLIVLSAAALTASAARAGVELEPAFPALGFVSPVDLQNAGDGSNRLFVVEKRGVVYVFENQTGVAAKTVFLDIQSKVNDAGSEEGLLGLAFHPDYPDTPYFYVNYTASDPRRSVIERYAVTANPDSADATSEFTLLEVAQPFSNHNAGQLAFGPDGMLYIGLGDGGSGGDPSGNGQNLQTLLGSILRIDVDTTDAGLNYGIPPDNPYHGNAEGYREEIWAHGLRNPWRYSFDPPTGRLWLADVGQSQWEEINIIRKGLNYGWNVLEGSHCYSTTPCDSSGLELPVWEYAHPIGQQRSITGGYVYRGTEVPVLAGHYIYADYITGEIWRLFYDGINPAASYPVVDAPFRISSFGRDENGNLFVLQYASSGAIWRLVESATAVNGGSPPAPPGELGQNTPNPFNPATTIEFTLREHGFAEIYVYGVDGRPVDRLAGGPHGAGPHSVTWRPGGGLPSGVYFYLLRLNGEVVDTRRMVLLK